MQAVGAMHPLSARQNGDVADHVDVVMGQTRDFSPPVWRMMQLLTEERSRWLILEPGEVAPDEVDSGWDSVSWTSLWTDRRGDQLLVEVFDDGLGSRLRWTLLSPEHDFPGEERVRQIRHRVNELFNESLRDYIDNHPS
jgi:hypothetical protein